MTTQSHKSLIIHTDGGSRGNPGPAATGISVLDESKTVVHEFGRYLGIATNNEAEYSAVIDALNWVIATWLPSYPVTQLIFKLDSNLVVEQLNRHWKIKEPRLIVLASEIWDLLQTHHLNATFTYIPREQNAAADKQVNLTLDSRH